jgi:hypothetical protein
MAVWNLEQDSELLFIGDAGTNEPSRPSRRTGVEWTNYYQFNDRLQWDADLAMTQARFTDFNPAGEHIPGAIGNVFTSGPTVRLTDRITWGLRLRYFGSRPLIEDNTVRSNTTELFNMHVGYTGPRMRASCDFLNLLNSKDQDITYFYTSRLPGEPAAGLADRHFHPVEPFGVRFNLAFTYRRRSLTCTVAADNMRCVLVAARRVMSTHGKQGTRCDSGTAPPLYANVRDVALLPPLPSFHEETDGEKAS